MAKFTASIRELVEGGVKIFDFDYDIFDPTYKAVLEQKIIDYYYFREIGLETPAQFKQFLKAKMDIIMPYYNQLYKSEKDFAAYIAESSPFFNANTTETHTRTNTTDSTGSGTSDTSNSDKEVFLDTPQGVLGDGTDYATNMTNNDGSTHQTSNSTGNITTTEDYTVSLKGDDGMRYPASVLMELRQSFLNIDRDIIQELSDLFMNVY